MKKKKEKLLLSNNLKQELTNAYILLDTNLLINIATGKDPYVELLSQFSQLNCNLFTIDYCIDEFYKGVQDEKIFNLKKAFVGKTLQKLGVSIQPSKKLISNEYFLQVIKTFRVSLAKHSLVDIYIIAYASIYSYLDNMFIATEDIKDFNIRGMDVAAIASVVRVNDVKNIIFTRIGSGMIDK